MNTLEREEKIQNIIKYGKYVVLIVIIGIIALIIINSKQSYSKVEKAMFASLQDYFSENNKKIINITLKEITKYNKKKNKKK